MASIREATKEWVETIIAKYKDRDDLNQVFFRGYFAGMSEREVFEFANKLRENEEKWPLFLPKK